MALRTGRFGVRSKRGIAAIGGIALAIYAVYLALAPSWQQR